MIPFNKFTLAAGLRLDSKEEDERREGDRLGGGCTYSQTETMGPRLPAGGGAVIWFNVTRQDLLQGGLDLPTGGRPLA